MNKNFFLIPLVGVIFFSSLLQIFSFKDKILFQIKQINYFKPYFAKHGVHQNPNRISGNPQSLKFKDNGKILDQINHDAHLKGQWSKPFDWPVIPMHSALLANGKVFTFGSYSIAKKFSDNIHENKKIELSDGRVLYRDKGDVQWHHHDVSGGVDFVIWDTKGFRDQNFKIYKKPLLVDAFCSIVKVIDDEKIMILGGNIYPNKKAPDFQKNVTIFDQKNQKFLNSFKLLYHRWYGSVVTMGDGRMVMLGGEDVSLKAKNNGISHIPEIILNDNNKYYSKELINSASNKFFGNENQDESWFYPRSYLLSDGSIGGISYNKIWKMNIDKNNFSSVKQVGEIKLVNSPGIISFEEVNPNIKENQKIYTGNIGANVGRGNSTVMIEKDKILVIGGLEINHVSSNKVSLIDFNNSDKVNVVDLKSMHYPRYNLDATILPNGNVFVNGGHSLRIHKEEEFTSDKTMSVLTPEIFNYKQNIWKKMSPSPYRRNYHSTTLLLPDGSLLVGGGDVWNAEIYYPPYLFEKTWDGKVIWAKKPKIKISKKKISRNQVLKINTENPLNIKSINLISSGSVTHAQGVEPKFKILDYKVNDKNELIVSFPNNKNEIQNGIYMLFAVNDKGTPSQAEMIYLKD